MTVFFLLLKSFLMKKSLVLLFCIILFSNLFLEDISGQKQMSFLHTSGQDIVNENGEKVFLKGVGLGNWLLPEGYMWLFGAAGDRPRKIEKVVSDLIGEDKAKDFWKEYRDNFITEKDIKIIADLGFNSVRPALNSRVFMTEEENPVFLEDGFRLIDSLVYWCNKHGIYVILDMHGAPGGQTGANIDDSPNDLPEFYMYEKYQDQLVSLWVKLAERYKNIPTVAAYDLLNEPLPVGTGAADKYKHLLIPVYQRLIYEIRKIDKKHMFTLEGYDWSGNWSLFEKSLDDNTFYQFHYYCWGRPDDLYAINQYFEQRDKLNTPIWVGESGEKGNTIYWGTTQYFEANNIGFSFWPWKKLDTKNTPYSIIKPNQWDLIAEFTKGGAKPDKEIAEQILIEYLKNIRVENCQYFEDVCNAILARVPGKIEAENYGQYGYNNSYFVKDTLNKSKYYRKNEYVQIVLDGKEDVFWSEQSVLLKKDEWVKYTFDNREDRTFSFIIKTASIDEDSKIEININGKKLKKNLKNKDLADISLGNHKLKLGENTLKIKVKTGELKLDYMKFD
jgi:aryl-phospho-beta-D-glucosidase BglC (GH1 family)